MFCKLYTLNRTLVLGFSQMSIKQEMYFTFSLSWQKNRIVMMKKIGGEVFLDSF